jgi:hypothetical protein
VSAVRVSYSLAVHNSAAYLERNLQRLVSRLQALPGSEVLLVENGSTDESLQLARRLAVEDSTAQVTVRADTAAKGYGNAHLRGLALARGDLVVMVGADLPFGFSDLDRWLALDDPPALVLGSKAHRRSHVTVTPARRAMSAAFRVARRLLLGLDAGDTQGSVLIRRELLDQVLPRLVCADFLISTEVAAWARELGFEPLEVPVEYPGPLAPSTVRPVADGMRMLAGLVGIRRRIRRAGTRRLESNPRSAASPHP